jgi:hypothetical protein
MWHFKQNFKQPTWWVQVTLHMKPSNNLLEVLNIQVAPNISSIIAHQVNPKTLNIQAFLECLM